ncbi:MAG: hypothetical protein WCK26_00670 [Candidatus Saccharibacteria bacterium]
MVTKKKVTSKKSAPRKVKKAKFESFQMSKDSTPFLQFLITEQTIYWMILLTLILALGIWVLSIQIEISNLLDSITFI